MLVPSGPGSKSHVFIIALGPSRLDGYGSDEQVVLVSFASVHPQTNYDTACVVRAGEHPFITHDSYVYYRDPRVESVVHVNEMVERGVWTPHEPCPPDLLRRIINGFQISKRVPRYLRDLL